MKLLTNVGLLAWMWFALSQASIAQTTDPVRTELDRVFANLNRSDIPTGVLREYGVAFANLEQFDGSTNANNIVDETAWSLIYHAFHSARISGTQSLPSINQVNTNTEAAQRSNSAVVVPLLYGQYASIRTDAVSSNLLRVQNNALYDVAGRTQNPYLTRNLFAAAPLRDFTEDGTFSIVFLSNHFYTNTTNTVQQIQVDMGDGGGFRTATFGTPLSASYTSVGERTLTIRITLNNGTNWQCYSKIKVLHPVSISARYAPLPIRTVTIAPRAGVHSGGKLQISYSSLNPVGGQNRLRKPFIVVEGLDLNSVSSKLKPNTDYETFIRNINAILNYNFNGQLDDIGGYDLVYLDYTDGVDAVTRNAALLEEALNLINAEKAANGSLEKNVIMGISMGGLVSRYCLASMTKGGRNPDTRLLITQDSPHRGANVLLGLQHLVNILGDVKIAVRLNPGTSIPLSTIGALVGKIGAGINANNSPGSMNQLLVRSTDANGTLAYNTFIETVYRPMVTFSSTDPQPAYRFVAISEGAECGQGSIPAGAQALGGSGRFALTLSRFIIPIAEVGYFFTANAKALPASGTQQICYFKLEYGIRLFTINITINITNKSINSPAGILPYDSGAGGTESISERTDLRDGAGPFNKGIDLFIFAVIFQGRIQHDQWCFVPTASALDATTFNASTLNTTFVGAVTPRSYTRSEKFITQEPFNPGTGTRFNRIHTTFTARNSQFIFNEMQNISNTLNCSNVCTNNVLVELDGPSTTDCTQNLLTYTAPMTNANSYTWSVGNSLTIISGQNTPTLTVRPESNGASLSTVTLNTVTTCNGTNINNTFTKNVTIQSGSINGTIQYTRNGSTQTVPLNTYNSIPSLNIVIAASLPGASSLTWTPIGTPPAFYQATNNGQTFTVQSSAAGCYSFSVSGTGSCGLRQRTVTFCLSNSSFRLAPNPASTSFRVEADTESELQSIREIKILDRFGNTLRNQTAAQGFGTTNFNISDLQPGIYSVLIYNSVKWEALKLIIQR
ncbi:MAG: T9SS type A sorting domain-containing protein [Saprospiraceae bacterium]|nr:T9SS type A sorting domain-containing protein [Saprospiraceae bacterium]